MPNCTHVQPFFDPKTCTVWYVASDLATLRPSERRDGIGEEEFVTMRKARDSTLELPTLILASIQVNVRAGQLPPADENGVAYLRIPLNALPTRK